MKLAIGAWIAVTLGHPGTGVRLIPQAKGPRPTPPTPPPTDLDTWDPRKRTKY